MKLLPINDKCVFCGLWGDVRTNILYGDELYTTLQNTVKYHPFKDESEKEIDIATGQKWRKSNSSYDMPKMPLYDNDIVEIGGRLSFTKAEYNKYKSKSLPQEKIAFVEKSLKGCNLLEYLNDYKRGHKGLITKIKEFKGSFKKFIKTLCQH